MKIRKDSWHWKVFLNWERRKKRADYYSRYRRPTNLTLCKYFWTVMFFAPMRWFYQREGKVKPWAVFIATVGVTGWAFMCYDAFLDAWYWTFVPALMPFLFLGAVVGAVLLLQWLVDRRDTDILSHGSEPKEPGLVGSYIKAKKNKVCPILEVVDD
jgi:fatty acid desaturase